MRKITLVSLLLANTALAGCTSALIDAGTTDGGASGTSSGSSTTPGTGSAKPVLLASLIQQPPARLVSDGTSVYWVSPASPVLANLYSVPATGGTVQTLVSGIPTSAPVFPELLSVDDTNAYVFSDYKAGPQRIAKDGSSGPAPLADTEVPVDLYYFQIVGSAFEWLVSNVSNGSTSLTSTPLKGGSDSVVASFGQWSSVESGEIFGATSNNVVVSLDVQNVVALVPFGYDAGPSASDGGVPGTIVVSGDTCTATVSDRGANSVYCLTSNSSTLLRIGDNGSVMTLGTVFNTPTVVFDDTYVYWVDNAPAGTIMRAAKTGGAPTVLARDMNPLAVAVDANAVYWSDQGGNIWRLAK